MQTVSATYAKQNFAAILDLCQREPVMIQRHGRNTSVIVSAVEYERFEQLREQNRLRSRESNGASDQMG